MKRVFFVVKRRKIYKMFIFRPWNRDCFLETPLKCTVILYQKTMQTLGFQDENLSAGVDIGFSSRRKEESFIKTMRYFTKTRRWSFLEIRIKSPAYSEQTETMRCVFVQKILLWFGQRKTFWKRVLPMWNSVPQNLHKLENLHCFLEKELKRSVNWNHRR